MASAGNIIDLVRQLIRAEDGSDVPVVSNEFLFEAIMDGQKKWEDAFQTTGENPLKDQLETGFDLVSDTTLNEPSGVATTDTEFTVDDNNSFDASSGALVLWDDNMPDIVSYTTYTSGTKTFSGVTGLAFAHEDEDTVQKLYKLPTNFGSFRESPMYGDGVQINGIPTKFIGGPVPTAWHFSLYDDGTNKFLVLPRDTTGSVSVLFNKASTTVDDTADIVSVPDSHKMFLVFHCAAYCYQGRADEANQYLFCQSESEKILNRALRNRNFGKKIRTRPFRRAMTDYTQIDGAIVPLFYG